MLLPPRVTMPRRSPSPSKARPSSAPLVRSASIRSFRFSGLLGSGVISPSMAVYVMIDSDRPAAVVWRHVGGKFKREVYVEPSDAVPLPEISVTLPLSEVYASVVWSEEKEEES